MTRSICACLALASAWLVVEAVPRAARPQYGGLLRVEMAATLRSLDPATPAADADEAAARARVLPLVFETLTRIDASAGLQPGLALAWEPDDRGARWRLRLRP